MKRRRFCKKLLAFAAIAAIVPTVVAIEPEREVYNLTFGYDDVMQKFIIEFTKQISKALDRHLMEGIKRCDFKGIETYER